MNPPAGDRGQRATAERRESTRQSRLAAADRRESNSNEGTSLEHPPGPYPIKVLYFVNAPQHSLPLSLQVQNNKNDPPAQLDDGKITLLPYDTEDNRAPKHVQFILRCAVHALSEFRRLNFCDPQPFNIELLDLSYRGYRGGTHPTEHNIQIELSLIAEDAYATIAHEMFHRIQYRYNITRDWDTYPQNPDALDPPLPPSAQALISARASIIESGARCAELWLMPGFDRYKVDGNLWFSQPGYPLLQPDAASPGTALPNAYGGVLFWKYVCEQHGRQSEGADTQRRLLEQLRFDPPKGGYYGDPGGDFPFAIGMLRRARRNMRGRGHFDKFLWPGDSSSVAVSSDTTWGNFVVAVALNGTAERDSRFNFRDASQSRASSSQHLSIPASRTFSIDALPISLGEIGRREDGARALTIDPPTRTLQRSREWWRRALLGFPANNVRATVTLYPYSFIGYRVVVPDDGETRLLRIQARPSNGLGDGFVQILMLESGGRLLDLFRHDFKAQGEMDRTVTCAGTTTIIILVSSTVQAGDFSLALSRVEKRALLFSTGWNAINGRHMTVDPRTSAWNWRSIDFYLDNARRDQSQPETGTLVVRLYNQGLVSADNVTVQIDWKPIERIFEKGGWLPVEGSPTCVLDKHNVDENGTDTTPIRVWHRDECRRRSAYEFDLRGCSNPPDDEVTSVSLNWEKTTKIWKSTPEFRNHDSSNVILRARVISADHPNKFWDSVKSKYESGFEIYCSPGGVQPTLLAEDEKEFRLTDDCDLSGEIDDPSAQRDQNSPCVLAVVCKNAG